MRTTKILLYTSILLLIVACSRTKETLNPDGTIKSRQEYKGKKLHGTSTWYYNNGSKELEIQYKDDQPDGVLLRWYYNGEKESMETFRAGKKNGVAKKWDVKGDIIEEVTYQNDSLHGAYTMYHDNGNVKIEGFYYLGLYDSTWTYFDENGRKIGDARYHKGKGTQRAFYPNGIVRVSIPFENNKRNGYELWFDQSGNQVNRILYRDDIQVTE